MTDDVHTGDPLADEILAQLPDVEAEEELEEEVGEPEEPAAPETGAPEEPEEPG
jgi:hypothetical protein